MSEKPSQTELDMKATVYRTPTGWSGYVTTADGDTLNDVHERLTAEEAFQRVMREFEEIVEAEESGLVDCGSCSGTGEGTYGSSRCIFCGGKGYKKLHPDEDE